MTNRSNGRQPVSFLEEVKALADDGDVDDALELLDIYLEECSDDIEAKLLKVEICIEREREAAVVGQMLAELAPQLRGTERYEWLRERAAAYAREKLAEGRQELRGGYIRDALACFDVATQVLPDDPTVALAAALALLETEEK